MIAGLRGIVEEIGPDWLLVNVSGVVFQVFTASSTLSSVGQPGTSVALHTHLQMREDGITLFGFATRAELQSFQLLLTVTGVGPRSALALLSAMSVDDLASAVVSEDLVRLSSVPGVGKRTAARIALELKGKIDRMAPVGVAAAGARNSAQLLAALTSLGYSSSEAASALRSAPHLAAMDLEEGLREALRLLSSDR